MIAWLDQKIIKFIHFLLCLLYLLIYLLMFEICDQVFVQKNFRPYHFHNCASFTLKILIFNFLSPNCWYNNHLDFLFFLSILFDLQMILICQLFHLNNHLSFLLLYFFSFWSTVSAYLCECNNIFIISSSSSFDDINVSSFLFSFLISFLFSSFLLSTFSFSFLFSSFFYFLLFHFHFYFLLFFIFYFFIFIFIFIFLTFWL